LFTRLSTVKPAFLASLKETEFISFGVLNHHGSALFSVE
jgi:hypothetical protein